MNSHLDITEAFQEFQQLYSEASNPLSNKKHSADNDSVICVLQGTTSGQVFSCTNQLDSKKRIEVKTVPVDPSVKERVLAWIRRK